MVLGKEVNLCNICSAAEVEYKKRRDASYELFLEEIEASTKMIASARQKHDERNKIAWAAYEAVIKKEHSF